MKLTLILVLIITSVIRAIDPKNVIKLGLRIKEQLEDRKGDGDMLKRNLRFYLDYMKDILKLIQQNSPEGEKLYAVLENASGPPHIKVQIYNVLMVRTFNWEFSDVDEIEKVIEDTKGTWDEIRTTVLNRTLSV